MKWIDYAVGLLMMGAAMYCAVAYLCAWPLTNLVWFGVSCGFGMAGLHRLEEADKK